MKLDRCSHLSCTGRKKVGLVSGLVKKEQGTLVQRYLVVVQLQVCSLWHQCRWLCIVV